MKTIKQSYMSYRGGSLHEKVKAIKHTFYRSGIKEIIKVEAEDKYKGYINDEDYLKNYKGYRFNTINEVKLNEIKEYYRRIKRSLKLIINEIIFIYKQTISLIFILLDRES